MDGCQDLGNGPSYSSPASMESQNMDNNSSQTQAFNNSESAGDAAGGENDAQEAKVRKTSMLSLGLVGAVSAMAIGGLVMKGEPLL